MKIYKKALLGIIVMLSVAVCFTFSASAETTSGKCGENVNWSFNSETGRLTITGSGDMYTDTSWRRDISWNTVKTAVIGNGVTSIGEKAFRYADTLTSVTIPDSVTRIGNEAFLSCDSITDITIPDSVISIGDSAFKYCDFESITIPNSVTSIGENAFYACENLESITIGSGVSSIGQDAFILCSSITDITVSTNNTHYSSDATGVLFNKDKTVLIKYPAADSRKTYTIPATVTSIDKYAFTSCANLTDITIPDSLTRIDEHAFYECESLESITIPDSVTTIGNYAFPGCTSLKSITISDSVTTIGDYAFNGCTTLESVTIPNSVTSIGFAAFSGCSNLTYIEISDSVTAINYGAFAYCTKLTDVYYTGTQSQWNAIDIASLNSPLTSANIHYESSAPLPHTHSYVSTTTKATLSKNGKLENKCSVCGDVKSTTTIYYPKTIKLSATKYTYNGKTKTPSVTVKDSKGKILKNGTDYTVTYPKKRKSIGKYTVTVKFKGNYSGTKKLTFKIVPAKAALSKVVAGSKKATAYWKTVSGASGYEVQYSTSSKFKSAKTATVKKGSTKKTTIKKLKKGKKYYFRVRAYKTVDGKRIYGAWSSVKSVKVK